MTRQATDCLFPVGHPRRHSKTGYGNWGCRCDGCCKANTDYMRENGWGGYAKDACPGCGEPKRVIAEMCASCRRALIFPVHGTESMYRRGCGCDSCREAVRVARAVRRAAMTDEQREAVRLRDNERRRKKAA